MFFDFSTSNATLLFILETIIGLGTFANILFGTIWCVYFLFRTNVSRRKLHYLKKQTAEKCVGEFLNAKVDYIKSIFIAAISFSEVLAHLGMTGEVFFQRMFRSQSLNLSNCTHERPFLELSYQHRGYRTICALGVVSILVFVSLIHILTSYLSHAYSEKRITNIMRRERVMFAWLFIQLVCV